MDYKSNLEDLAVDAFGLDINVRAETKVSSRRHVVEWLIPGFSSPIMLMKGDHPDGSGLALYARSGLSVLRQCGFEYVCCEFMVF